MDSPTCNLLGERGSLASLLCLLCLNSCLRILWRHSVQLPALQWHMSRSGAVCVIHQQLWRFQGHKVQDLHEPEGVKGLTVSLTLAAQVLTSCCSNTAAMHDFWNLSGSCATPLNLATYT